MSELITYVLLDETDWGYAHPVGDKHVVVARILESERIQQITCFAPQDALIVSGHIPYLITINYVTDQVPLDDVRAELSRLGVSYDSLGMLYHSMPGFGISWLSASQQSNNLSIVRAHVITGETL